MYLCLINYFRKKKRKKRVFGDIPKPKPKCQWSPQFLSYGENRGSLYMCKLHNPSQNGGVFLISLVTKIRSPHAWLWPYGIVTSSCLFCNTTSVCCISFLQNILNCPTWHKFCSSRLDIILKWPATKWCNRTRISYDNNIIPCNTGQPRLTNR